MKLVVWSFRRLVIRGARKRRAAFAGAAAVVLLAAASPFGQSAGADARRRNLDQLLDLYVRDGYVYYRALRQDRRLLDAYVASLTAASVDAAPRAEQIAFWINAYNALVLRTVVDNYPIRQRSRDYPSPSIRQIPGAFERLTHRIAHKSLTLDQIEQTILSGFQDPRIFLALGRGAVSGGRLRSEAFAPETLERQLTDAAAECISRVQCVQLDRPANKLLVSPVFSWREKEFAAAYADKAPALYAARSPIERAVITFVEPQLLTTEREVLERNTFAVEFVPFDWSLNDLTGRGGH
jgi:hypothetical protein